MASYSHAANLGLATDSDDDGAASNNDGAPPPAAAGGGDVRRRVSVDSAGSGFSVEGKHWAYLPLADTSTAPPDNNKSMALPSPPVPSSIQKQRSWSVGSAAESVDNSFGFGEGAGGATKSPDAPGVASVVTISDGSDSSSDDRDSSDT